MEKTFRRCDGVVLLFTGHLVRIACLILLLMQCRSVERDSLFMERSTSFGLTKVTGYVHNRDVYPQTKDITINVSNVSGSERSIQIKFPINDDATFSC